MSNNAKQMSNNEAITREIEFQEMALAKKELARMNAENKARVKRRTGKSNNNNNNINTKGLTSVNTSGSEWNIKPGNSNNNTVPSALKAPKTLKRTFGNRRLNLNPSSTPEFNEKGTLTVRMRKNKRQTRRVKRS